MALYQVTAMYVLYTYTTCVLFLLNIILVVTVADDDSNNELSTGVAVAISVVVTFIITLVVTALVSVVITSLYYKHLIGKIHESVAGYKQNNVRKVDPLYHTCKQAGNNQNNIKKVDPLYHKSTINQNGH